MRDPPTVAKDLHRLAKTGDDRLRFLGRGERHHRGDRDDHRDDLMAHPNETKTITHRGGSSSSGQRNGRLSSLEGFTIALGTSGSSQRPLIGKRVAETPAGLSGR